MDWVLYLVGGFLTIGGAVVGYFAWAYNYFSGELTKDPTYRTEAAGALTDHSWLQRYRNTLQRALDWLDRWMGAPSSFRALGVCVTISMVYALMFFLGSWAVGGPGKVGNTELLPRLPWWQQVLWSAGALLYTSATGLAVYFHQWIDRTAQDWLTRSLQPLFSARAEAIAKWLYRLGAAGAAASIVSV